MKETDRDVVVSKSFDVNHRTVRNSYANLTPFSHHFPMSLYTKEGY